MCYSLSQSMILEQFSVSHPMCYFLNQIYDTGTVQCISSNVLLTFSIRSMILEQFSVSHPMCYSLSQSDLWYWNSSVYLIQCVTHFLNQIYDTGTVQCISSNVLLTFSIRSMILEQFSVSHPMCYFLNQIYDTGTVQCISSNVLLSQSDLWYWNSSVYLIQCVTHFLNQIYDTGTVQCISSNVLLTFSIRSMILEQFSVSHPMCYSLSQSDLWYWNSSVYLIQCVTHFLNQIYDTGTVQCISSNVLLTFSIRSMILEQFSVSHPMCYSLSQSDLWYWNSSVYLIQCVTHFLNQIYDTGTVQCISSNVLLSQSDLWYWNSSVYLIQCVTHYLNQIYDTGTVQCISSNVLLTFSIRSMILEQFSVSHPMCYSLSQSDLWYWNSSVYLIQCVTHFLNQIYDTGTVQCISSNVLLSQSDLWYWNSSVYLIQCVTHCLNQIYDTRTVQCISSNVLLTFSIRSMILEQFSVSHPMCYSLSQSDLWYWNSSVYLIQCVTHFLNQTYDTGTVQCISSNVLLSQSDLWYWNSSVYLIQCVTFSIRSMILEQFSVSHPMCYSLSQSDLWYWNSSVYLIQCVTHFLNQIYDTGTVQCISSNVLLTFSIRSMILEQFSVSHPMCYSLSQSDLWYWNSSVYLIQCVTHFLNQIYDTEQFSVSHPMCYFLNQIYDTGTVQCISSNVLLTSQSDLWYWNSSVYLIQCVTHFLNQIYDTGTVQCISSNVLLTFSIRSMILEQFSVSHPMCYSLSQSDLWYWNSSVYLIQCVTFSIRSMILEQFSVSHPMCYSLSQSDLWYWNSSVYLIQCVTHFLNQIYDTGTVQCISSNVLLTFSIRSMILEQFSVSHPMCYSLSQSMILEQFSVSHPMCYSLSQSDLWYWNSSVYLIQCVTHFLNQIYDTGTVQCISSNVLLSQSDLWYWNSSVYLIQCVTHFLNQIYDTGTVQCISSNVFTFSIRSMILEQFSVSHPMCYSLSQSDLWYWNSSVYLIQCVTFSIRSMILEQFSVSHPMCYFLNQIYDTGTVQCISSNVLLTFSIRSMILEQFSVSHPMCYSLSQSDLWYWNSSVYLIQCVTHFLNQIYDTGTVQCISSNVLLTFSIRSMILEQFSVSHPMCYSLSQSDLWYWNSSVYLIQCVTHFLNQIYDTGTVQCISSNVLLTFSIRSMILEQFSVSHPMCHFLNQIYDTGTVQCISSNVLLTFSTRSMILEQEMLSRQCVTHFLNQIYDTGTGNVISDNVLLTFSIRSMILEQFSVSYPMCYSLSQSDLWY